MLPFGQLPLPNTPQQVFFLRTTDVVVLSCKTQNILSARQSIPLLVINLIINAQQAIINSGKIWIKDLLKKESDEV